MKYPLGRKIFEWTTGAPAIDFQKSNLRVVNDGQRITLQELRRYLHKRPEHPDRIPFRVYREIPYGVAHSERAAQHR